ncbi:GNAT family N-acetyltransferase [Blautia sp. HCP3S3_H10_1]|uniref:GNAT family N-acetyltransferase n=1 Tax=unclassified Blautia TaxID=2648079 RepID=UPI003F8DCFF0|nr:GNAT family N-acetyltransferase [Clostridia bacterium]
MIKKSGKEFYLCPLEKEDIEEVLLLCDRCVGKNLYQKEELAQTIGSKERWFLLLKTAEGELAGYIYYYITNAGQIAEDSRISIEKIRQACGQTLEHVEKMQSAGKIQPVGKMQSAGKMLPAEKLQPVGKIQSVGVKEAFRGQGLAVHMVQYVMNQFSEKGIGEVFIICWNAGGRVPLAKTLQKCRFIHLSSAKKIWYDKEDLFCPYCKGRCKCDAEVYFKKGNTNENQASS